MGTIESVGASFCDFSDFCKISFVWFYKRSVCFGLLVMSLNNVVMAFDAVYSC